MVEQEQWRNKTEEVFSEDPRFKNGKEDYQEFVLGRTPIPSLIVNGKKYELFWHPLHTTDNYIVQFRSILFAAEERLSEGNAYHVRLRDYESLEQFLPIKPEDIKRQLFGFGWAALDGGDLAIALSALRASETLGEDQVVRKLKYLSAREEVKLYLQLRILQEEALAKGAAHRLETRMGRKRARAQRALKRARQTLKILKEIL